MTAPKYKELEQKIVELQAEVDRLKREKISKKHRDIITEEFHRYVCVESVLEVLEDNPYGLYKCFAWDLSPQGYMYWSEIADSNRLPTKAKAILQEWVIKRYQEGGGQPSERRAYPNA